MTDINFEKMLSEVQNMNCDIKTKIEILLGNLRRYEKNALILTKDNPMIQMELRIPLHYIASFDYVDANCEYYNGFDVRMILLSDYGMFKANKTSVIFNFATEQEAANKVFKLNKLLG